MEKKLQNLKVAIIATNGVERSELVEPKKVLEENGASVHLISFKNGKIKSWQKGNWADEFEVDKTLDSIDPNDYDALILPGGIINAYQLKRSNKAVDFVKDFILHEKPIAAICHGPWLLVETGMLRGKKLTSQPSLKTDLKNAGANWIDEEVVANAGLITSRTIADIPAFNKKMVEEFSKIRMKEEA